jgi:hypothetical protein
MHIVASPAVSRQPSNTRFTVGDHIADVLLDEKHRAKVFHWIVQRVGSPSIIMWGQEYTYDDACVEAQRYLESLVQADNLKQA